jgi:hypothetical protein
VNKYTVNTYKVCQEGGGGGGLWVHRREGSSDSYCTPAAKSLYWSIFLDNNIWHCLLSV